MSNTHHLSVPFLTSDLELLEIGDLVYLTGEIIVTAGLPTHERIKEYVETGRALPMDFRNSMLCQVGCYVENKKEKIVSRYINPSTSTRFEPFLPQIIEGTHLKAIGGKGGVGHKTIKAMKANSCVYLSFIGGASALTSESVKEVLDVEWNDFIMQFRLIRLRVERLGPLNVGVDTKGNSLYANLQISAEERLEDLMEELNRDRQG